MYSKLFDIFKKKADNPTGITFGRYSDNNKTVNKVNRWTDAEQLFKDGAYYKSIQACFDYLQDDKQQNVQFSLEDEKGTFQLCQGSKIVRGNFDSDTFRAEITLARMPQPSVPVMRRLLDMNFKLYYSRYAMDQDRLCMCFDSDIKSASPHKLYYGLKELAVKADKLDDLLVQEFATLQTVDTDHIIEIPVGEKEVKYEFMMKWIKESLEYIATLDADKLAGGIAYLLLSLGFRIVYLISPDGKLLNELEKVFEIYYKKDDKQTIERNQGMMEGFRKLLDQPKEEVFPYLFRSKHTFSNVAPQPYQAVADIINTTAQNGAWFLENNYSDVFNRIMEYPLLFCQYSYSLPKPLSDLILLFMQVNYPDYFKALNFTAHYYDPVAKRFDAAAVKEQIDEIIAVWKAKYPKLQFRKDMLKLNNLVGFNSSFSTEIPLLNFDTN